MAGPRCTICSHPERATIDQLLARGTLSVRAIADQFGVGRNSLARHHENHVLKAVQRQVRQRREREDTQVANVWEERLHETYASARRGIERAEADPEQWHAGARFLAVATKITETGLKATGQIEGGRPSTEVRIDQVIVLPLSRSQERQRPTVIPVQALPEE
jgi:transposase-like protein